MKKAPLIMKKMWVGKIKFIDSEELKNICKEINVEYKNMSSYLLSRKYLIRIFRGIFYVKSVEEIKFNRIDISPLDLVAKGLELKGVKNWYFGLYTALRLNNITHEYFAADFVINDKIFRAKEITIAGHKFKFIKIKSSLIFGIKNSHSDLEKTILDFIYLGKYRGVPDVKILLDVSELVDKASRKKLSDYVKKYPKSVKDMLERIE